jgi:hypothetical protein
MHASQNPVPRVETRLQRQTRLLREARARRLLALQDAADPAAGGAVSGAGVTWRVLRWSSARAERRA